jgi:hypothetical protein
MRGVCWVLLLALVGVGCGAQEEAATKGAAASAPQLSGKSDVTDGVRQRGALGLEAEGAVSDRLSEDLEYHGYTLALRAGAEVSVEVTQRGSSRGLDTTLYLFGPQDAQGGYGAQAAAFDDDGGYGALSRLRASLPVGGRYLVVVGSYNGRGRGTYRVEARCENGACAPLPLAEASCHPALSEAITRCVQDQQEDADYDPSVVSELELIAQCSDVEPVAPAWDALCAGEGAPAEVCGLSIEQLALEHLPICKHELTDNYLDGRCVFGDRYRDLWGAESPLVVVSGRTLVAGDALTALEEAQIVEAVHRTSHDDVQTASEAFAVVDDNEVHQHVLWDASNRRAFVVYEVGAGDNSFGAYFAEGSAEVVAEINDGDIGACGVTWGPERRRCDAQAPCAEGLRCVGEPAEGGQGRCLDLARDQSPANGQSCAPAAPCPVAEGLLCADLSQDGEGLCLPAWQRGRFSSEPALSIPDNRPEGVEVQLLASGLATVSTDVTLELVISHPRISDLRVSLVNPAGTEAPVFMGEREGQELYLSGVAVRGFPGDESANGVWRLKVGPTCGAGRPAAWARSR